jgi:hypothetical protein
MDVRSTCIASVPVDETALSAAGAATVDVLSIVMMADFYCSEIGSRLSHRALLETPEFSLCTVNNWQKPTILRVIADLPIRFACQTRVDCGTYSMLLECHSGDASVSVVKE